MEGEVYAFSSFCTALVFWLILKWENRADRPHADRYLVLIAYVIGVSIAVHLLNLLCIPAIVLVIYYRKFKDTNAKGSLIALAISAAIVALILYGLVPGFIEVAGYFEIFFVNTLGTPYNIGVLFYALLFVGVIIWCVRSLYRQRSVSAIRWSFLLSVLLSGIPFIGSSLWIPVVLTAALAFWLWTARKLPVRWLTLSALSIMVIFAGYSSYALLLIRSAANPPMNQNAPDNVFDLASYLSREQYGDTPLLYGHTFASTVQRELTDAGEYTYRKKLGKDIYTKVVKNSPDEPDRYVVARQQSSYEMVPKMLFPRMYSTAGSHPKTYMEWINADESDLDRVTVPLVVDSDGNTIQETELARPTFAQNMSYFLNYQLNYMYWRYFMWNFAGRQNDYAGQGEANRGNWISGIPFIDNPRLGDQSLLPDEYGKGNKGHNVFYMLPLLMGVLGLCWQSFHSKRGIEQFWVIFFFFFMTGIAIVLYLNQPPLQPRERDYAFAGSFYAFAIWVGMGVAAISAILHHLLKDKKKEAGAAAPSDGRGKALLAAGVAAAAGVLVPLQMVSQTWDDHDRSGRYTTRDFGMNYLSSVDPNGIIFTNGDNDTFPLWYAQEVEGFRTDVRVVNLSYLTTDWYAHQMRVATDGASGIPVSASPADYAYDRLQYSFFDPENMSSEEVSAATSLDDLYHSPQATYNGSRVMRYPMMYIPANAGAAARAGVIEERELPAAEEAIRIDLPNDPYNTSGGVTLSQALSLDMINTQVQNGWNRPAYFAMTVPDEFYLSMGPYMRNTGLAYQVTPLRNPEQGDAGNHPWTATDKMYRNVTGKFRWGGLDAPDAKGLYLDETVRRMVSSMRSGIYTIVENLMMTPGLPASDESRRVASENGLDEPQTHADMARQLLDIMEAKMPGDVSLYDGMLGLYFARTYLDLYLLQGKVEDSRKQLRSVVAKPTAMHSL